MSKRTLLKKNDLVMVIAGDSRGKKARVVRVIGERALLDPVDEGDSAVNRVKRHTKKQADKNHPDGGIITKEATIHHSNLMKLDRWLARREQPES